MTKLKHLPLLLLLTQTAQAVHDFPDRFRDPPEPKAPLCRKWMIPACVSTSAEGAATKREQLKPIQSRLRSSSAEVAAAAQGERQIQLALSSLLTEIYALENEKIFLSVPGNSPRSSLLPGFPALEDFFQISDLEQDWQEIAPGERLKILSARLRQAREEESARTRALEEKSAEISGLKHKHSALEAQRSELEAAIHEHELMRFRGCRDVYCPGEF